LSCLASNNFHFSEVLAFTFFILFVLFSSASLTNADDQSFGAAENVQFQSCYGGDTCRFDFSTWPNIVGKGMPVRVKGIDTPEMQGECQQENKLARKAKQRTITMLEKADRITLEDIERGSTSDWWRR